MAIKEWETEFTHTDDDIWGKINELIREVNRLSEIEENQDDSKIQEATGRD